MHRAWENGTLRAIYDTSLALAKQLNMEAVAEGVQDRQDWNLLRRTDCNLAQGNFIARAMLADAFEAWLVDWQKRLKAEDLLSVQPGN